MTDPKLHFDDLTKINVPFGLLDGDTRARLLKAKNIQYFDYRGWNEKVPSITLVEHMTFRDAPM